jgi:hypothetical protein
MGTGDRSGETTLSGGQNDKVSRVEQAHVGAILARSFTRLSYWLHCLIGPKGNLALDRASNGGMEPVFAATVH